VNLSASYQAEMQNVTHYHTAYYTSSHDGRAHTT